MHNDISETGSIPVSDFLIIYCDVYGVGTSSAVYDHTQHNSYTQQNGYSQLNGLPGSELKNEGDQSILATLVTRYNNT